MEEATIIVLAAGMGSRFGGIKQMAGVGPNEEWLLEYSLYDAWRAGFRRVIFIIRPELEASFEATISKRIRSFFKIEYAYQTNAANVPDSIDLSCRKKPLGTGHALLCARHLIQGPFTVINADDYYGPQAYREMYDQMKSLVDKRTGAMVAYRLEETLSDYGPVARGLCEMDLHNHLVNVQERTGLNRVETRIQDEYGVTIHEDTWVSMNIWCLPPSFLTYLEKQFLDFLKYELVYNPRTAEFYLPKSINAAIAAKELTIQVNFSTDKWTGMTYIEDFSNTKQQLCDLYAKGIYPAQLWTIEAFYSAIMEAFGYKNVVSVAPITEGHINTTFLVTVEQFMQTEKFILQRINTQVFQQPEQLMANIEAVTHYIQSKGLSTLSLIYTIKGKRLYIDENDQYWRLYRYVEDTQVPTAQASTGELHAAGYAFGTFQNALSGFDASVLNEVIPDFHNTPARYAQLQHAVSRNPLGRSALLAEELAFAKGLSAKIDFIVNDLASGKLPLRVTHNDTKVNNVLLSRKTGEGLCVIDLDTVMPGSLLYDYGDGIRSTVTGRAEDERNVSAIGVDLERFEAFTAGFLKGIGNSLTDSELNNLLNGAVLMTYECGIRFLSDYILGDVYFKIDYPDQNLVRARSQFKLVKALLSEQGALESIIKQLYLRGHHNE